MPKGVRHADAGIGAIIGCQLGGSGGGGSGTAGSTATEPRDARHCMKASAAA